MAKTLAPTDHDALKPIVEAMIFASEEPLGPRVLIRMLFEDDTKPVEKEAVVEKSAESLFDSAETGVESNGEDTNEEQIQVGSDGGRELEQQSAETGAPTESDGELESGETAGTVRERSGNKTRETEGTEAGERTPKSRTENSEKKVGQKELRLIIDELNEEYEESGRPFRIVEIAGGFQFATTREYGEFVGLLAKEKSRRRLSQAALETLAIVAYRQPVTKPEVEAIRGVNCDQVLLSLLERNLLRISGRAETVGKPLLYGTTEEFLRAFGLNSLSDLPKLRELEELMEEEAHSGTKTSAIPEQVTDELLELAHEAREQMGNGEPVKVVGNGAEGEAEVVAGDGGGASPEEAESVAGDASEATAGSAGEDAEDDGIHAGGSIELVEEPHYPDGEGSVDLETARTIPDPESISDDEEPDVDELEAEASDGESDTEEVRTDMTAEETAEIDSSLIELEAGSEESGSPEEDSEERVEGENVGEEPEADAEANGEHEQAEELQEDRS